MGPGLRNKGGFIIHVAVAAYTFLALAIICDEFFVPSLEKMCEGEIARKCPLAGVENGFRFVSCI